MSRFLWKFYLEDDVESFCQVLEESGSARSVALAQRSFTSNQTKIGSPGAFANSPSSIARSYNDTNTQPATPRQAKSRFADVVLTRTDINRKDGKGMTLLHYAASSTNESAISFALALIAHPLIDLYTQDLENGWTALHRSFYFGNITIARAILERETQNKLVGQGLGGLPSQDARLIRAKDHEGNGPFDLLTETIKDRTLHHQDMGAQFVARVPCALDDGDDRDSDSEDCRSQVTGDHMGSNTNLQGDETFTFGSNKNITLGLGNEDDRQFPERVHLKRPEHLYRRFLREHFENLASRIADASPVYSDRILQISKSCQESRNMPAAIRSRPIVMRDVQMSKFHSAILTDDPICNLYVCGHGPGGRLGTGNEKTQFSFVCIEDGLLSKKKTIAIALGQDHSVAVTEDGDLFTWGSNTYGQLGTGMSKTSLNAEEPLQLVPKQVFGALKREEVVGVAASRIHSVVHTATALFTFGKNEGQLGIVDANAGSLEVQSTPRRVAASRFSCAIQSVSAIDRATVCLLENHEVHVFANYGAVKLQFPLDGFMNSTLNDSVRITRYDDRPNTIVKVTSGGDTICALSSSGEIFAVSVDQRLDPASSASASTTNPTKIRAALSTPARVWTLKKGHMNARDVGVDRDGSIVLTTEAGSVWRRVRRTNLPGQRPSSASQRKSKDFKFSRVPGLTRVIAVRASASGAYCAVRRDCNVTQTQIVVNGKTLWQDVGALLPFKNIDSLEEANVATPIASFWTRPKPLQKIVACIAGSKDLEKDIEYILTRVPNTYCSNYNATVGTTVSDIKIPIHIFVLASRSRFIRNAMGVSRRGGFWENDVLSITTTTSGNATIIFKGLDFLSIVELVLYVYTDELIGFWLRSRDAPELAFRYRQVRVELMKIANKLEMRNLESAARKMAASAVPCLNLDLELALSDPDFLQSGDTMLQLKDAEVLVHSDLLSRRCPFFEGLFQGRAGGNWLAGRRQLLSDSLESIGVDFTHVELSTFKFVLRFLYADTDEELFDEVVAEDLDEFLDVVLDALSVANELMLDRMAQICQLVLGRHVNTRNACGILNAVAPSAVPEFKNSALEYACLNLESMLTNQYLDELDEDLLQELDGVVRDNQLTMMPIVKSGRAEADLLERYPDLAARIDRDRQAKVDTLNLQMKYADHQHVFGTSLHAEDDENFQSRAKQRRRRSGHPLSPKLAAQEPQSPRIEAISSSLGQGLMMSGTPPLPPSTPVHKLSAVAFERTPGPLNSLPAAGLQSSPSTDGRSWGKTAVTPDKLGIKEIMAQAAPSRMSGISLGLASQANKESDFAGTINTRMSQKERRRMMQQRQQQQGEARSSGTNTPVIASNSLPSSPWQTVTKSKSSIKVDALTANAPPSVPRAPTPQLTMRQTVANAPSIAKGKVSPVTQYVQTQPGSKRSVSNPQVSSSPASRLAMSSPPSSASKPIEIHSIRHVPRPDAQISPTFSMHQSMADILAQQEAEKSVVKEAVAKRSLQEIQQEQEFLTWWDNESKRVADEEAATAAAEVRFANASVRGRGRSGESRRDRGRPVRGKGKAKAAASDKVK